MSWWQQSAFGPSSRRVEADARDRLTASEWAAWIPGEHPCKKGGGCRAAGPCQRCGQGGVERPESDDQSLQEAILTWLDADSSSTLSGFEIGFGIGRDNYPDADFNSRKTLPGAPEGAVRRQTSAAHWDQPRSPGSNSPAKVPPLSWPKWAPSQIPANTLAQILEDVQRKLMWARCKGACLFSECGVVNGCNCGECPADKSCVKGKCCEKFECCEGNCPLAPMMNFEDVSKGLGLGKTYGCNKEKNRCICLESDFDGCLGSKGCACPSGSYCRQMCQAFVGGKADPPVECSQATYEDHLKDTAIYYKNKKIPFAIDTWGECVFDDNVKPDKKWA